MQTGGSCLCDEFWILSETNTVGSNVNAFESNASSVAHRLQEDICDSRLSTGKQNDHLALGRHQKSTVENTPYVVHRKFMNVRCVVCIHVAWRAFQVAAVGQIYDQSDSAPGSNR